MQKFLDQKLAKILADPACKDFMLADAKDADMAYGIAAPGKSPEHHAMEGKFRTLAEYRQQIRDVIKQAQVDIVLMSASTNELLTIEERLFDESPVTPAARANDTTDIHLATGGRYMHYPSRPFRSATIDHIQCGKYACTPQERQLGANLGLYSVTFNNDLERDVATLQAFRDFRLEAEKKGFRYFLEVFDPNIPGAVEPDKLGQFINDHIVRDLAGVTKAGRPLFLKVVYHGPRFMEQLAAYDPGLIPGILGGSSGTTYDAFKMLAEAKKYGARIALYGRKINNAEHQLAFISFLRLIADEDITPEDAVHAYHAVLQKLKIQPYRSLQDDLKITNPVMSYSGPTTVSVSITKTAKAYSRGADRVPDFKHMTQKEKLAYNLDKIRNS
ncbi:hypothetical protein EH223_11555 [candidate division KSB1 bacterium]|nr:hypothetical protein [candidate division KSB1 bacterium]RQW02819.1 MAG: hypothetical protein EH223_11555 [candidate division KSB1 bacterium]